MSKTEKVINDLNVAKHILCNPQMLTFEMNIRIGQAITNVLALLKEQEAKSPVVCKKNSCWIHVCPTCGSHDEELFREWSHCPYCGQAVKWE